MSSAPPSPAPGRDGTGALSRRLGTGQAVGIGLAAMVGAGVFTAFAPAAESAGSWLLAGLALAALIAFCNATSTVQLAAVHPVSGGAYAYGRAELGPWWGFLAGWSFVVGKTASVGAFGLTVGAYLAPPGWDHAVAVAAVLAVTAVNLLGVTRTATAARLLVAFAIAGLPFGVAAAAVAARSTPPAPPEPFGGPYGVLPSAGLLF